MKIVKSFGYALKGLSYAFKTQQNFRIHTSIALLVALSGFLFELNSTEWIWIIAAASIVFIAELANTAIETLVDLVSPEYNVKAGIVKDLAAAFVLLSAIAAVGIGLIIFIPKVFYAS